MKGSCVPGCTCSRHKQLGPCPSDCTCGRHTMQLWSDDPQRNRKGRPLSRKCAPGCTCARHTAVHGPQPDTTSPKTCKVCGFTGARDEFYAGQLVCKPCGRKKQTEYRHGFNLTLEQLAALKMSGEMERCRRCNFEQLKCNFYYETGARRRDNLCLTCGRDQLRRNRTTRPEAHRKHSRQSADLVRAKKHGLTREELLQLKEELGKACNICGTEIGSKIHGLSLDHDHLTNEVRGYLCSSCNRALGFVGDSIKRLQQLIAYLRNPPARKLRLGKNVLTLSA